MSMNGDPSRTSRTLDPDVLPWEQQPAESDEAYAGFIHYRDAEKRSVRDVPGGNGSRWSMRWSWSIRCLEWDRFVHRQDAEVLVRYRIQMAERQRATARFAQQKLIQWLTDLDPSKLTPNEAARWFEVAVRVEREAAGAKVTDLEPTPQPLVRDPFEGMSLGEVLGMGERADSDELVMAAAEEIFAQLEGQDVRDFQHSIDEAEDPPAGPR